MRHKRLYLAILSALLIGGMSIGPAWSYFTDTHEANGSLVIKLKPTTRITERYDGVKHLQIANLETSETDVFVRARAYASVDLAIDGEGWFDGGDGWWYYGTSADNLTVLEIGGVANDLNVTVTMPESEVSDDPYGTRPGSNFNVAVVYESTPVRYKANGTTDADWDNPLNRGTEEGGN